MEGGRLVLLSEVRDRATVATGQPKTLAEIWDTYQRTQAATDHSPATRRNYAAVVRHALREVPEASAGGAHGGVWSEWLCGCCQRGLSRKTANTWLSYLRAVVGEVAGLTGSPEAVQLWRSLKAVRPNVVARERIRAPSDRIVERLFRAAGDNPCARLAVSLCAFQGLRIGECLALAEGDWDAARGLLSVERSRGMLGVGPRKNGRGPRAVLHVVKPDGETAALLTRLCSYRLRQTWAPYRGPRREAWGVRPMTPWLSAGYLLPWSPRYPATIWETWRRADGELRDAFGPGDAWHCLRHWFASKQLDRGVSVDGLMRALGDASPRSALEYCRSLRGDAPEGMHSAVADAFRASRSRSTDLFGDVTVAGNPAGHGGGHV